MEANMIFTHPTKAIKCVKKLVRYAPKTNP